MKITRTTMELDALFSDKEMQERYFTNAYWLPTLPDVEGTYERYLKTIEKSREWKGEEYGDLVIASERLKTIDGEMLLFSFPVEELYEIAIVSREGSLDSFQIQSVTNGTLVSGYRELTISETGRALTRIGYFNPKRCEYSIEY